MLTVTAPAEVHDLTTVQAAKDALDLSGNEDNEILADLIRRASAAVVSYCNRTFARETVTETFRLDCRAETLSLARFPVVSVASVTEAGTALAAADYEFDASRGLLSRLDGADGRSAWSAGKIVVTYTAGFILPGNLNANLPADIEAATIALAKGAWFARGRDPLVKSEDVQAVAATTYWIPGGAMPPDVAGLLDPHRSVPMG